MAGKFKNSIITTVNPRYSVNFDGTGDYISAPGSSSFAFGTGNFTVEFWLYCTVAWAGQTNPGVVGQKQGDGTAGWQIYRNGGSNDMYVRIVNTNDYGSAATPATQVWEHWALVRSGSNLTWYRNGTATFTHTGFSQNITDTAGLLYIGYTQTWGGTLNAIISNLRIVKGTAVYTGTFAVPTSPLSIVQPSSTNITALTGSETVLLTCQDSTIKDNSANPVTFTVNGDTSITGFNPFGSPFSGATTTTFTGRFNKNDILYAIQDNNWKGYTSLDVDVLCVGAGGGCGGFDSSPAAAGGAGATIMGRINVPSSKILTVIAGGGGRGGNNGTGAAGGIGGLPGGGAGGTSGGSGSSGSGGGGGGWSGIFDTSYSVSFDNTGDYLTIPHNTALDLWVGDFTIECWVFSNANQSNYDGIITKGGGTDAGWQMVVVSNAVNVEINGSTLFFSPSTTLPNNTWVHLAIVKSGTNVSLFQNGTRISAITGSSSTYSTTNNVYIGADRAAGNFFNGYISSVRLVKGTAVYDPTLTTLTPPTPPLTAITNTSLLTCQSSTIIDNGPNAFTITVNGDAAVKISGATVYSNTEPFVRYFIAGGGSGGGGGNEGISNDVNTAGGGIQWNGANGVSLIGTAGANYPGDGGGTGGGGGGLYGGAGQSLPTGLSSGGGNYINPSYAVNSYFSNYFDGTGDYLSTTLTAQSPGSGDFTYECWFNVANSGSNRAFWNTRSGDTADGFDIYVKTSGLIEITYQNTVLFTSSASASFNVWNHIAVVRSGTTWTIFLNGASIGTFTNSTNFTSTTLYVGAATTGNFSFLGSISNFRYVRGTAVYTSTFTPSTTPLTAISGTSILTCQSSTIIDKSTNNFTITRNGDVIVREIHPFAPPTINAELGGGIGFATGSFSLPANVNFFGYTSAGAGGTFGNNINPGANGTVVIRYTGYQKAIGGTVDYDNGYTIHTYDSPGTFVLQ